MSPPVDDLGIGRAVRAISRRWWLLLAAGGAAVAGSTLMVALQTPIYRGEVRLLVDTVPDSAFNSGSVAAATADRAVRTAVQAMTGTAVRARVDELVGDSAPGATASVVGATDVVVLRVEAADSTTARYLADAYATAYIEVSATSAVRELAAARDEVQRQRDAVTVRLEAVVAELSEMPDDDGSRPGLVQLQASLTVQQSTLDGRLAEFDIDLALQDGGAAVLREATASSTPVRPEPLRAIGLASVLGLMVGAGAALVAARRERGMATSRELAAQVDVPLLAKLPNAPAPDKRPLALSQPEHPFVEQIRVIRDGIAFAGVDRGIRTVLVTSASAGEGKTTVASNLAVAAAEAGARVLLIDADLRSPAVARAFAIAESPGLTDALLSGGVRAVDVAPQLKVLPAGSSAPNPAVLVSSTALATLLREASDAFDLVVVDGPPVPVAVDATVLAGRVDGVVIVVRALHSDPTAVHEAIARLRRSGAQLVGTVFNAASARHATTPLAPYGVGDSA